ARACFPPGAGSGLFRNLSPRHRVSSGYNVSWHPNGLSGVEPSMRILRRFLGSLVVLALLTSSLAAAPPNPLRLVPDQAELVIKVERPRQLIKTVTTLDLVKQLQSFEPARDLLENTNYRQFQQLLSYFEKQLSAPWPELLDRLGSGGVVLAVKYGTQPTP